MTDVDALPFDPGIGYPQQQQVNILGTAYTVYYRWNPENGGFCVLKIVRNADGATVLNSRIDDLTALPVRDPATYQSLFVTFPNTITASACEVWLFYD